MQTKKHFFQIIVTFFLISFYPFVGAVETVNIAATKGWIRWLPSNLPAAGYMEIENRGKVALSLIGATSPDYNSVMLHQTISNGTTTRMVHVEKIVLQPNRQISIKPGGYHFMLSNPTHTISLGDIVTLELKFSDGKTLSTKMKVSPPNHNQ